MLALGAVPGIILSAGMLVLPESPRWLAGHGRESDSDAVLRSLRGSEDASLELRALRSDLAREGRVVANNRGHLRVLFFGNNTEQEFGFDALNRGFLKRFLLEKGRRCQAGVEPCVIEQLATDGQGTSAKAHDQRRKPAAGGRSHGAPHF